MSEQVYEKTDVTITRFVGEFGPAWRVTWSSGIKGHFFDYVHFYSLEEAEQMAELLQNRYRRKS